MMDDTKPPTTAADNGRGADEHDGPGLTYKPRRRAAGQAVRVDRPGKPKPARSKRPMKLVVDVDVYEALVVHGLRRGKTLSQLVGELVRQNLTDWIVHAKPGPRSGP